MKNLIVPSKPNDESLTDAQKTKVLLNSQRLPNEDAFIIEFKSWEYPSVEEFTKKIDGETSSILSD